MSKSSASPVSAHRALPPSRSASIDCFSPIGPNRHWQWRRCSMPDRVLKLAPPRRPDRENRVDMLDAVGDAARPLGWFEKISQITAVRRLVILVFLAAMWQGYAVFL